MYELLVSSELWLNDIYAARLANLVSELLVQVTTLLLSSEFQLFFRAFSLLDA